MGMRERDPKTGRYLKMPMNPILPAAMSKIYYDSLHALDKALSKWEKVLMDG
jgi:hypothetical protein